MRRSMRPTLPPSSRDQMRRERWSSCWDVARVQVGNRVADGPLPIGCGDVSRVSRSANPRVLANTYGAMCSAYNSSRAIAANRSESPRRPVRSQFTRHLGQQRTCRASAHPIESRLPPFLPKACGTLVLGDVVAQQRRYSRARLRWHADLRIATRRPAAIALGHEQRSWCRPSACQLTVCASIGRNRAAASATARAVLGFGTLVHRVHGRGDPSFSPEEVPPYRCDVLDGGLISVGQ